MEFKELSEIWCRDKSRIVKRSTMCAYSLALKTHLLPFFGLMSEVNEVQVQEFVFEKCSIGLSNKTVHDVVAVLMSILKYGAKRSLFCVSEMEIEYPRKNQCRTLPLLSFRDQRTLMLKMAESPSPKTIGVLLALCAGMRIGEVCGLRWEDVDLVRKAIRIRRTVGRIYDCGSRQTSLIASTPKTSNSFREIPISRQLTIALRAVKARSTGDYVVGGRNVPCDPRSYRDYFTRLLKRLGIPSIVFHGLRHTFATRCIESGCDIKTLSSILGHSNVATTLNLYVHPDFQQKKRCIDKMENSLGINARNSSQQLTGMNGGRKPSSTERPELAGKDADTSNHYLLE